MTSRLGFSAKEARVALDWHAGASSMLYAIGSSRVLERGTIRPNKANGIPMTDVEWFVYLLIKLEIEALEAAHFAAEEAQSKSLQIEVRVAAKAEEQVLRAIARKAREEIDFFEDQPSLEMLPI